MAINISDSGSTILVSITTTQTNTTYPAIGEYSFNKQETDISGSGSYVRIKDDTYDFSFIYSDITTPSGGSASAVAALIEAFLDTGTNFSRGATSTTSNVAASITVVTLKAANTSRVKLVVVHDDTASTLYVKEGATATATDFTYKLSPGDTLIIDDYTGIVTGIWSAATGTARVTETV